MARRFVSIWFPFLATDWHARKQPRLQNTAFVLKASFHNRTVITAASPQAQAQGIQPGTVLADARALVPSLVALDDKPGLTGQLLQRIAEWCIRFTPAAAPDAPGGVVLDATGCAHLWGGEEAYLQDITQRLRARGYTSRCAVADTVGCAWAVARYGQNNNVVESGKQTQALLPLPVSSLRLDADTTVRLHKLGLRRVGDLVGLSRSALRRRFAPLLVQRLKQALGEEEENFTPVYPPVPYCERLPALEPIVTRTGIEAALQRLLHRICLRLRNEANGLRTASFRCYRMDGGAQGLEIGTGRATHSAEHVFQLFSLKLHTIHPGEGIELFVLEATRVEACPPMQEEFWADPGAANDQGVSELIDRLAGKLGPGIVHRYLPAEHWWPERSFKRTSSLNEEPSTSWQVTRPRPLHLLSPPAQIDVTAPVPDYPPMNFRYNGTLHTVVHADGPERIEQEWWIQEGEHRDYYCVEDEKGNRYWLFRSGHYSEEKAPLWYLHGFFA